MKFSFIDILLLGFQGFTDPYSSSTKEPGMCIVPGMLPLPTFVIESGWSESSPQLNASKDLWLIGAPSVERVLLILWTKISDTKVKGDLQVHGRNPTGNAVLLQTEVGNSPA